MNKNKVGAQEHGNQQEPTVWDTDVPKETLKEMLDGVAGDNKLNKLLREQLEVAKMEANARWKQFVAGQGLLDMALGSSERVLQAQLDISQKLAHKLAALEAHWQRAKSVEKMSQERFDAGRIGIQDVAQSRFYRIRAEIQLERAKAGLPNKSD